MKKVLAFLVVMTVTISLVNTSLRAQTNAQTEAQKPYIEITGIAEKEIIPDEIYVRIIIRERYVNKEKIPIEVQEQKLKDFLKSTGINMANLSLSNADADFVRIRFRKKDVLTQKDYTLKLADAPTLGKVFEHLDSLEISDAYVFK